MVKRPDIDDFLPIFLNDVPLIDTRAPVEFEKGAFPTSISLPLMSNEERARVGTCYKQQGQQAAIALGHSLVSGDIKARRVQAWVAFARAHPDGYLYCWRGGLRSQICQQWMREAGVDYPRIVGGYKAMRHDLLIRFERICQAHPMVLLGGRTGSDKTTLLNSLPNSVDLEGLAHHRGSSFGRRPGGQPSQLNFENALGVALLKVTHGERVGHDAPVLLEDEGRMVGSCALPPALQQAMAHAPLVVMDVPLEERIEHTWRNYILRKLEEWQSVLGDSAGFDAFADDLNQSLYRVRKRLGGARYQNTAMQLDKALAAHRAGNPALHRDWIQSLLVDYYDPMYDYQLDKRADQILFRGDRAAVTAHLASLRVQTGWPRHT